jgi:hypothetical protein
MISCYLGRFRKVFNDAVKPPTQYALIVQILSPVALSLFAACIAYGQRLCLVSQRQEASHWENYVSPRYLLVFDEKFRSNQLGFWEIEPTTP